MTLTQEKSTTYTYSAGDGYYYSLVVYDNGLVEILIYYNRIMLPMFVKALFLGRYRSINSILSDIEKGHNDNVRDYHTFIEITKTTRLVDLLP